MKFSANLSFMFTEHSSLFDRWSDNDNDNDDDDNADRYKAAKAAGFSAVEVAFPYDEDKKALAEMKDSLGLEQVLLNTKVGPSLGHGARKGEEKQFMESMKTSLEYCQALGVGRLHFMAGYRLEGVDTKGAIEVFEDNLRLDSPIYSNTLNEDLQKAIIYFKY